MLLKINLKSKDPKMILKPLLKKNFLNYFPKKLIYKKQGFSGYMNELYNHINNTNIANDPKDISLWKDACYQIMEAV